MVEKPGFWKRVRNTAFPKIKDPKDEYLWFALWVVVCLGCLFFVCPRFCEEPDVKAPAPAAKETEM